MAGWNTQTVQLPGDPGKVLLATDVNFKPYSQSTSDGDAACSGTYLAPTAPRGMVCLYLVGGTGDMPGVSGRGLLDMRVPMFEVQWYDDHTEDDLVLLQVTWAHTAP